MPESKGTKVARLVTSSAKWGYGGSIVKIVIQLGAQATLARLLGPIEYGVFAIGLIIVSLSVYLAESGAGAALIQRQTVSRDLITFAFSVQTVIGVVVMASVMIAANQIAIFYNEPRVANVVQALSIVVLITAMGSISSSLLKKHLDFKNLQIGQVSGFFVGYVVFGIPAALLGAGVWSLVIAWLVQSLLTTAYWYSKANHPFKISFKASEGYELIRFGWQTVLSNVATWAGGNIDKIIVGKALPASALALYAIPFTFMGTIATQVLGTLQPLLFSASSQMNGNKPALRSAFLELLEGVSLILLPVFITVAFIPEIVLNGIYGSQWLGASEIMRGAAWCMAWYVLGAVCTPILWALAEVKAEARVQIIATISIAIMTIILIPYGASAVAWGVAAISFGRMFFISVLICRTLNISSFTYIRALTPSVLAGSASALAAVYLDIWLAGFHLNGIHSLLISIASSVIIVSLSVLAMYKRLLSPPIKARIKQLTRIAFRRNS